MEGKSLREREEGTMRSQRRRSGMHCEDVPLQKDESIAQNPRGSVRWRRWHRKQRRLEPAAEEPVDSAGQRLVSHSHRHKVAGSNGLERRVG